ncbi:MAG: phenylalanine--tRNA ligase subunit beta [Candidatus Pacearchaeota archaeon]
MAIITLNRKELEKNIGKITKDLEEKITMFGTTIEEISDDEISIEIYPNRPDLLSLQGFIRAMLNFLEKRQNIPEYIVEKPEKDFKVIIDKSVKKVRPFTACAIVKNLKFDEERIKNIIDIQEKLHLVFGRNRKKLAIGIYPLEQIKLPIRFLAKKPEEIKFQPLEFPKEINGRQILSQHPKGREFGYLLDNCEVFPIFQDANNEILSMPPIINSHKTGKIKNETKEIFIECSGFNIEYLKKALNIIVTALSDMGGKIISMEIIDEKENKKYLTPILELEKKEFSIDFVNKTLGLNLNEKQIKPLLEKMGLGYEKDKERYYALIPSYRTDIIHEIDIVEDIAIAYGYENFIPEIPKISTIGEEDIMAILKRKISELLIGLNMLEISTYHLTTKEIEYKKLGFKEYGDIIEIIDSKTENNILRTSLLSQSIKILSENSDASYPQKIFEIGKVFYEDDSKETGIGEKENLCISICHDKANFTEIKQILDYLSRMLDFKYEIKEITHPTFIDGRCGQVIINKKIAGVIGEVHPNVLKNNKIKMPVSSIEINIETIK